MARSMLVLSLVLLIPSVALSDGVTFILDVVETAPSFGTFELLADVDAAPNRGLAAYSVQLTGDFPSIDHKSPQAVVFDPTANSLKDIGFRLLRSPDGQSIVHASQNNLPPDSPGGHVVYELGQTSGDLAAVVASPELLLVSGSEQPIYSAPLLLADGTWSGAIPDIALGGNAPTGANVFKPAADATTMSATVAKHVNFFPWRSGDFDGDGVLTAVDIDRLTSAVRAAARMEEVSPDFDLNFDGVVDRLDRIVWVNERRKTYFGDANLDGQFDSADLILVFQAGEYEDQIARNSTWADGDWDGDGEFSTADLIVAFQAGGYERGPRAAVTVPEPSVAFWNVAILVGVFEVARGSRRRCTRSRVA